MCRQDTDTTSSAPSERNSCCRWSLFAVRWERSDSQEHRNSFSSSNTYLIQIPTKHRQQKHNASKRIFNKTQTRFGSINEVNDWRTVLFYTERKRSTSFNENKFNDLTVTLQIAEKWGKPTRVPRSLIPIRQNKSRMVLKWLTTLGRNSEYRGSLNDTLLYTHCISPFGLELVINPLITKLYLSDLKTQFVPRSKHSLLRF